MEKSDYKELKRNYWIFKSQSLRYSVWINLASCDAKYLGMNPLAEKPLSRILLNNRNSTLTSATKLQVLYKIDDITVMKGRKKMDLVTFGAI